MGFFDKLKTAATEAVQTGLSKPSGSGTRDAGGSTDFLSKVLEGLVQHAKSEGWGTVAAGDSPKWQNTNIGGVGSDRDKELRKAAAETESEFDGAGEELGLEIWRVEKFKPIRQPRNTFGSFFTGDSYIVLHTYQLPGEAKYRWDLFFWLGAESTQDEKGSAAYFTVNLDDKLDTFPVQHRETEGSETEEFLALFDGKFSVQEGGIGAGWQEGGVAFTGTPEKTTFSADSGDMIGARLPKKLVRISDESGEIQLEIVDEGTTVSSSKLTEDDPFGLVVGDEALYIWMGRGCSPAERLYVTDAAESFLVQLGLDKSTPVTFVKDGQEPPQWKAYVK
mmetsp:Transcript_5841/g.10353  ORF Transcript_5841/g.10353 Transcript_5841/m.10353 type:complete len:335 (-) Transcript_5841:1230-2234(-)